MSCSEVNHQKLSTPIRISLFLLSTATLIFEINLTRIFSVSQFYHFAFMIVSLALFGFGASGSILSIFPNFGRRNPRRSLAYLSLGASFCIIGAYLLTNWVPFDSFSIAWDRRQIGILFLHYIALATPFFFCGTAVGLLLDAYSSIAGQIYAINLIGSAVGCAGALWATALFGGEGTVVLSASVAALGSLIVGLYPRQWKRVFIAKNFFATVMLLMGSVYLVTRIVGAGTYSFLNLNLSPYKSLSYALQYPDSKIISQDWNPFSRVDVVRSTMIRSLPGLSYRYINPPPPEDGLFVDGDDLNPIIIPGSDLSFTKFLPSAVVYHLRPNADTLILNSRGGLDVLVAQNEGGGRVTAVEANELIVSAASYIYQNNSVKVVLEGERSYLRRSDDRYDVIIFTLTNTYHPVRSGAYSLMEDYRYTIEAYEDSLERLKPEGILVITRWLQVPPSEWLRAFVTAVTALEEIGLDPAARIVAYRTYNIGTLLVKVSPFTQNELSHIRKFASERSYDIVFSPDIQPEEVNLYNILLEPMYYDAFSVFTSDTSRENWLSSYPFDVSPPTDNHPFYSHFFKWSQVGQVFAEFGKTWQPFGGAGYFVIIVLLAVAIVMAVALILLPIFLSQRRSRKESPFQKSRKRLTFAVFLYFGLIGLGFLLIEIPLIQKYILYLGQPAYSMSVVLFSILFFSGLGSQHSQKISHRASLILLCLISLSIPVILPGIFNITLGFPIFGRVAISILSIAPIGFLMGIPFPKGIQLLEGTNIDLIPWVWGVNGATSVVSSILAAFLALSFGFNWVIVAGGMFYFGAFTTIKTIKAGQAPQIHQ